MGKKVMVIGLDCAAPPLIFKKWLNDLPNIKRLVETGVHGKLRSSDPPITVPAWATLVTGQDPGQLGFYGFRNRTEYDYSSMSIVDSRSLTADTIWDILGKKGYQSIVIGVPPSFPPKPLNGCSVSCFLTPGTDVSYTYPANLAEEVEQVIGNYQFDVENFRSAAPDDILKQIYDMTEKRFKLASHLIRTKDWDFFMMVEMGVDRIHHTFWHHMDEKHVLYEPNSPYRLAIYDYYTFVDRKVGQLLEQVKDDCLVLVVSDHGAKRMDGGFCLNEWLIREGLLTLKQPVDRITPLTPDMVNWQKTRAWGYGGYYGRIHLNVKGREPSGVIPKHRYEHVRNRLIKKLTALKDERGTPLGTKAYKPEQLYRKTRNIPPDLLVYFGRLFWRSIGSVGHRKLYVYENDSGPDGANHDYHGIFIASRLNSHKKVAGAGRTVERLRLLDVTPSLLRYFGIEPPRSMQGKSIPL